jgi:arylsulfatase A-like enzyme
VAAGALWAGAAAPTATRAAAAAPAPRPNIVVVTTDDQDAASVTPRTMPNVDRLLRRPGTEFTDFVASGPLCCPSRAAMLTGQYGHNNGVLWNGPGGYPSLRDKRNTLPVWLARAGYRTAHVGKYLNDYAKATGRPNRVAPGWSQWHTILEPVQYYDYVLRVNGTARRYNHRATDYLTRVLNATAVRLVERYAPRPAPPYLQLDQFAPHRSGWVDRRCRRFPTPDPRDAGLFRNEPVPRSPSFDEQDVSDKPSFVSARPPLSPADRTAVAREQGCRLASLRAVDRGVGQVAAALARAGELDDTVFIFTSDNGWLQGQHRIPSGKIYPYEEDARLPLIVRLPRRLAPAGGTPRTNAAPVANIDLAPTILALARAKPCDGSGCRVLDGRSLLPLLRGRPSAWPSQRGILLELKATFGQAPPLTPCDFQGVRAGQRVYLEHHSSTGPPDAPSGSRCEPHEERELYDLGRDPFQLDNIAAPAGATQVPADQAQLAARLARLRDCAGIGGRDPRPSSGHYCE